MILRSIAATVLGAWALGVPVSASADGPYRKIGELELSLLGVSATVDPAEPVVPKNIASAVRIVVRAGAGELSAAEVARFLGPGFAVEAELSGPGLRETVTLPYLQPGEPAPADPLLLPLPALTIAGDYSLTNVRIVSGGRSALDVQPSRVKLRVIDQILVTSVKTRPLTLDEIKEKGIVLDQDDYLGFEFTMGLKLDSKVVNLSFPVVFDRKGVPVPEAQYKTPDDPTRETTRPPTPGGGIAHVLPMLLELDGPGGQKIPLTLPDGQPVRIPSVVVIPGNVGYLKQFFSAQLFVANGAPVGSGLVVRDVSGTLKLPPGADLQPGTADDPLALPETVRGVQPSTLPVRGVGPDGAPDSGDDVDAFAPAEQGQAEFLIRGEQEGFHTIDFDVRATLEGLPLGPVAVTGKATGGVLVRNPYFDITFTVPSVVRENERFRMFVTVANIGQGVGNDVSVSLDAARMSGLELDCVTWASDPKTRDLPCDGTLRIPTLAPRDAQLLEFPFRSLRTGQVTAAYLRFDADGDPANVTGDIRFTMGVGERGVPLSPDTLTLPTPIASLPSGLVSAAMRVLGQAWSVANAAPGTLPAGVQKISTAVVVQKALALAEAGLRMDLGQPEGAALRDIAFDFYGGSSFDAGFDQLLRETEAGREFAAALGAVLGPAMEAGGGILLYELEAARLAASGPDFIGLGIGQAHFGAPLVATLTDAAGRATSSGGTTAGQVAGTVFLPVGGGGALLGLVTRPSAGPYTLELDGTGVGATDLSLTLPRGDGTFLRATFAGIDVAPGSRARLVIDTARPDSLTLDVDMDGDGSFESRLDPVVETIEPEGAQLLTANLIGPETLSGAGPFGQSVAFLFDRVVDAASAGNPARYAIPKNTVVAVRRQLTGRLVLGSLDQPEGPHVPTSVSVSGIADGRGVVGPPATVPLESRLADIGGVLSGRVVNADGTPAAVSQVIYLNQGGALGSEECAFFNPRALAAVPVAADGTYEVRFAMRNRCGHPFVVRAQDPSTGALREGRGYVRFDGEPLIVDLALVGQGSVTGVVRDLAGQPVPGADVVAVSATDPNLGGGTQTDGDGRYTITNLTVGAIAVRAGKGPALGRAAGRIDRAGTTATIDVTLDGGAVSVSGSFLQVKDGVPLPVVGALLSYRVAGGAASGYAFTDELGEYVFEAMPVGAFSVSGSGEGPYGRASATATGVGSLGDRLTGVNLVSEVLPATEYGEVRGFVRLPSGQPPEKVIVAQDISGLVIFDGTYARPDGSFTLGGLPVGTVGVGAITPDRLRQAQTRVTIDPVTKVGQVVLTLSGMGAVEFTVLDPIGNPIPNQAVSLLGSGLTVGGCHDPCGCRTVTTDSVGRARFEGLALGSYTVQAVRVGAGYTDVARGSASITRDGETGFGIVRFAGAGTVSGVVLPPPGVVLQGGDITLTSKVFRNDGYSVCGLVSEVSHRATIDPSNNTFRFTGVNVGPVGVRATNPFTSAAVGANGTITNNGQDVSFTLQFVDTTAGILSGTVLLPDGVTLAGAGVEVTANGPLPDVTVGTNASGRFEFARIFPQGTYTLTARDPVTGGLGRTSVALRAAQDAVQSVRLQGRGSVRVRVVDGSDSPVASAFVKLRETDFPDRSYDDAIEPQDGGLALFPSVFEGGFSVEVKDAFNRGGRASGTLPAPGAEVEVKVRLSATGTVTGRFLLPGGSPVPFGVVKLIAGGRVIGQVTTPGSGDGVGSFGFDYVPAGQVRLEAQDPLTQRSGVAAGTIEADGETLTLDVVAQGLGTVRGLVTSRRSGDVPAPEPGAGVEVVSGAYKVSTLADAAGRYEVNGVPEGQVVVTASLAGGLLKGTASATLNGDGTELTIDVALRDSGTVFGRVYEADGATPGPISQLEINIGGTGGGKQTTTTDADGYYRFDRVPSGRGEISVNALDSIDRAKVSVEVPSGELELPIVLNGVGGITGTTLSGSGQPIGGDLTLSGTGVFKWNSVIKVGSDGVFNLPEVLAGPFTASLRARVGEFTLYGTAAGEVLPDQTTSIEVQLQPSGRVTGIVRRSDGATPAAGTDVTLELSGGRGSVRVQAQTDGSFNVRGVPLGAFTARFADPLTAGYALRTGLSLDSDGDLLDLGEVVLDDTPVAVVAFDPADGTQGVAVNQPLRVTFSDPLNGTAGVSVLNGTQAVSASASLSADKLTVTLQGNWPDARELTIRASTSVRDIYGRYMAQTVTSRFRTVDLSPPTVSSIVPANGSIQVAPDAAIVVTFSEPLSIATDLTSLVRLNGGAFAGTAELTAPAVVTFIPAAPLPANAAYTVTVVGAIDESGNQQTTAFTSSFKGLDSIPPVMTLSSPAAGGWVKTARPSISVSASDALSGIDSATARLVLDGVQVAAALSHTPGADLAQGPHGFEASVADKAGNATSLSSTFSVDSVAPEAAVLGGVSEGQTVAGTIALSATATDATSGVAKIEVLSETGSVLVSLLAPGFAGSYNTNGLSEGAHSLSARAVDVAGNVGPAGPSMNVIVNNKVLTVVITSPAANTPVRDSIVVKASVSEPVAHVEFAAGSVVVRDTASPYEATLDLTSAAEGPVSVTATGLSLAGETATAGQTVVVDRTPPATPDATKITAEESDAGFALVSGVAGAVEGKATVEVTNLATGGMASATAAQDGSFAVRLLASLGTEISLRAIDSVGNAGPPTLVVVERRTVSGGVPLLGLRLWTAADSGVTTDESGYVTLWEDQSEAQNDLRQTTAANRPLLVVDGFNGFPVLRFDGSNDFMSFTTVLNGAIRTVFWVVREDEAATSGSRSLLGSGSSYADFAGGSGAPGPIWGSGAHANIRNGQTWLNGAIVNGQTTPRPRTMSVVSLVTTGSVSADRFGTSPAYSYHPWWGDLAELIVYDRPLSASERQAVEDYLVRKYRPYTPTAGTPSIQPSGGVFTGSTTVTLTTTTPEASVYYTLDGSEPDESATPYSGPFILTHTATIKARAFKAGFNPSSTAVATLVETSSAVPWNTTGLRLWLRADAGIATQGGDWVTSWADQSGSENNALQANGNQAPRLVRDASNGLPALRFDGADDFVGFTTALNGVIRTVFWVVREDAAATSANRSILGSGSSYADFAGGLGAPGPIWGSGAHANVRNGQTFVNGLPVNGQTTPRPRTMSVVSLVTTGTVSADRFGTSPAYSYDPWWGDLAELIVYDRALTDDERRQVEDYLNARYGLFLR